MGVRSIAVPVEDPLPLLVLPVEVGLTTISMKDWVAFGAVPLLAVKVRL
jgi:hypothetical protein